MCSGQPWNKAHGGTHCAKPEPIKVYSTLVAALGDPKDGSFASGGVCFPFSSSCAC